LNQFEVKSLVDQAYENATLKKEEIAALLAADINDLDYLLQKADQKRKESVEMRFI